MKVYLVGHWRDGMTVPYSVHGDLDGAYYAVEELFATQHLGGHEALEWPDEFAWEQHNDVDYHWWHLHGEGNQVHLWPIDDVRDLDDELAGSQV